jgi:OTU domain-containing protein 6
VHCSSLYSAVDDQLKLHGDGGLGTKALRKMAGQYLKEHKSDFLPFISHPDTGDQLTDEQYGEYCDEVAYTSAWGGELEVS